MLLKKTGGLNSNKHLKNRKVKYRGYSFDGSYCVFLDNAVNKNVGHLACFVCSFFCGICIGWAALKLPSGTTFEKYRNIFQKNDQID